MTNSYAIGVDLGGTKLLVGAIDSSGEITERRRVVTDVQSGAQAVKQQMKHAIWEIIRAKGRKPSSIGIGVPGQVDPKQGTVIFAPNLQWRNVPIQQELEEEFGLAVHITNDVRAATWGEWRVGAAAGCQDLVCLFVGTGIGGGIVSQGRLIEGASNVAGEFGHTVIRLGGHRCTCGQAGCFEAYASGWAIAKAAKEMIQSGPLDGKAILEQAQGNLESVGAREVAAAFKKGDPLASQIIDGVVQALVAGGTSIVNALNPQRLIFGGGVINGIPELIKPVREGIKKYALSSASRELEVLPARLGGDAGIIGASFFSTHSSS